MHPTSRLWHPGSIPTEQAARRQDQSPKWTALLRGRKSLDWTCLEHQSSLRAGATCPSQLSGFCQSNPRKAVRVNAPCIRAHRLLRSSSESSTTCQHRTLTYTLIQLLLTSVRLTQLMLRNRIATLAMETTLDSVIGEISAVLGSSPLRISEKHCGFSHDIIVLKSPSGQTWILRMAKDDFAADMANRSVHIMEHILDERPALPIPAIVHAGQRYSVLTYIEGTPLMSWNVSCFSDQRRHSLLRGLAKFLHQLWTCPAPVEPSKICYICGSELH